MNPAVRRFARLLLFLAIAASCAILQRAVAQRRPVLEQIDLPHSYYFREMYLPQLTSGPSSVAWSPDSQSVVYSMGGSLWRQKISETFAQQLTDGDGYDYQPDWSPDGKSIVYCSYQKDALEFWLLDVASGATTQLTSGGAVNVEPRWSPDGKKILFVSTSYNKRFHIFVGDIRGGKLENVMRVTGETKSSLPRYYYSAYDMEISPVWSRDGQEILFVSNRGHIHGTGGFWRMKAQAGAEAREIHYEETNWKARPEFSPDGSRIVYSSYLGRNWHQLWIIPANGGDAFPLTYGDYDITNVRWSPNGRTLAYISNEFGNTSLSLLAVPGADIRVLTHRSLQYKVPHTDISLRILDETGSQVAARVSVTDARGKFYAPFVSLVAADDSYERTERPFEAHYFEKSAHSVGPLLLGPPNGSQDSDDSSSTAFDLEAISVPIGAISIEVMKGFSYQIARTLINVKQSSPEVVTIRLSPLDFDPSPDAAWISSDLHVHMNYGGMYRNSPQLLVEQANSEGLGLVNELIVNKEQRFPDVVLDRERETKYTYKNTILVSGQEFHTSYWGHRGLLNIREHILLPGYAGYPNTAAASLYPMNADVYDMAHAQGAVVGAVHPFDEIPDPFAVPAQRITDELPIDVALGKLDYMEIVGFSDHRSTAAVWYRLLNLGYRIPAGGGTDAMANFASLRGPVGLNRVYARVPPLDVKAWLVALKKGLTFATNGPLLEFSLNGQRHRGRTNIGRASQVTVAFSAKLRSIVPVDHLEVVCNGKVAQTLKLNATRTSSDVSGTLPISESGWCVLRASSDKAEYPVLDNYVYATTSPIYITVDGKTPHSPDDAKYFAAWIDRLNETTAAYPDWNSAEEKAYVLGRIAEARNVYERLEQ